MKKRCLYCGTIVKCDNTIVDKEKGYGVYCDVCGSFIKLPKQVNGNVISNSPYSRRLAYRKRKQETRVKKILAGAIFVMSFIIIPVFYFSWILPNTFTMPEQTTYSVFILYDNQTNIDVSDNIEMSILFPKKDSTFDDIDDANNMSKYEVGIIEKASDIQLDIRYILYFYVQIDPLNKTTYCSDYHLIVGGNNHQFQFYLYVKI